MAVNPLLSGKVTSGNSTMQDPRQRAITPVLESYEGDNNAYRGIEQHGVPQTEEFSDVPGYDGTVLVPYDEPEKQPDPVPVKII